MPGGSEVRSLRTDITRTVAREERTRAPGNMAWRDREGSSFGSGGMQVKILCQLLQLPPPTNSPTVHAAITQSEFSQGQERERLMTRSVLCAPKFLSKTPEAKRLHRCWSGSRVARKWKGEMISLMSAFVFAARLPNLPSFALRPRKTWTRILAHTVHVRVSGSVEHDCRKFSSANSLLIP